MSELTFFPVFDCFLYHHGSTLDLWKRTFSVAVASGHYAAGGVAVASGHNVAPFEHNATAFQGRGSNVVSLEAILVLLGLANKEPATTIHLGQTIYTNSNTPQKLGDYNWEVPVICSGICDSIL